MRWTPDTATPFDNALAADLIAIAGIYCQAKGISEQTLSQYAVKNRYFVARLARGFRRFSMESCEALLQYMSDTWPEGVAWPLVVRPAPQPRPVKKLGRPPGSTNKRKDHDDGKSIRNSQAAK
jgi:hypothetical protein